MNNQLVLRANTLYIYFILPILKQIL